MILITGATGFLGRYLVTYFAEKGRKIVAYARNQEKVQKLFSELDNVEIRIGDILNPIDLAEAMEGVEYVIHTAAIVSFYKADREQMKRVNVQGTANIVNIALEFQVKKLLFVSSIATFDRISASGVISEKNKWNPKTKTSFYAKTKYAAELEVFRGIEEGLPAVICNPGVILGFGDWEQSSPTVFKNVYKGLTRYPSGMNGFVGVMDVVRACDALLNSDKENGEKYILVANSLAYKDQLGMIANGLNKKPPTKQAPNFLVRAVASLLEMLTSRPKISKELARTLTQKYQYDGTRIVREFDFQYEPIKKTISEACSQYLDFVKKN